MSQILSGHSVSLCRPIDRIGNIRYTDLIRIDCTCISSVGVIDFTVLLEKEDMLPPWECRGLCSGSECQCDGQWKWTGISNVVTLM